MSAGSIRFGRSATLSSEIIKVPDIGGDTDVEIIEIAVSEGDVIEAEERI